MPAQPIKILALSALAALFIGCAGGHRDIYYWGHYEDAIYDMYLEPGQASLTDEILRLEEQIDQAAAAGQPLPPGFHAHLAYLYVSNGNYAAAVSHFNKEKELFPESTVFIDGILGRMKK